MTSEQAASTTETIFELYAAHGGAEYAGERITQLEHMVQAAQLAEEEGHEEEVILAAFLHDIGHICVGGHMDDADPESARPADARKDIGETMESKNTRLNDKDPRMGGFGIRDHEEIGAEFLTQQGFSRRLVRLVESHVEAKRWLVLREPGYYEQLSEASKRTLEFQGGPMDEEEAAVFEQYPLFGLIIRMRKWDEQAKIEGKTVPDLGRYRDMMIRHLEKEGLKGE